MPYLLIISDKDIYREETASALTIRSFVENWGCNHISQIVCNDFNSYPSGIIDSHTYHLAHDSVWIGSRIIKDKRKVSTTTFVPSSIKSNSKKRIGLDQFRSFIVGIYQELPYRIDKELSEWLNTIKVDAIYTEFTDARTMKLVKNLSSFFNVPVIPHFMDDWPSVYLPHNAFTNSLYKSFNHRLKQFLKSCDVCFCISESMCREYKKRYGIDIFIPLMHSVEIYNNYCPFGFKDTIRLLYSGSLYLDRYKSLLVLCEALWQIKHKVFEFNIYCSKKQWEGVSTLFERYLFVKYRGFVNQEVLLNEVENTDILVFAESFDARMLSFTKFSLSTKVPEYLSSGRPILAMGHSEQGSIDYLKSHNAAYIAANEREVSSAVINLVKGNDYDTVMTNAQKLFEENHVKSKQQEKFKEYIKLAIKKYGVSK